MRALYQVAVKACLAGFCKRFAIEPICWERFFETPGTPLSPNPYAATDLGKIQRMYWFQRQTHSGAWSKEKMEAFDALQPRLASVLSKSVNPTMNRSTTPLPSAKHEQVRANAARSLLVDRSGHRKDVDRATSRVFNTPMRLYCSSPGGMVWGAFVDCYDGAR
jgi:hypothetical protein